ncbi:hypothetical protein J5751_05020 [bacterium]|nr:hypothetical protein [bacterium]
MIIKKELTEEAKNLIKKYPELINALADNIKYGIEKDLEDYDGWEKEEDAEDVYITDIINAIEDYEHNYGWNKELKN